MAFTSVVFLVLFFPACVLINYFLAEKYRNVFLCAASLVFYFWCGIQFLVLIIASSCFAYALGLLITRAKRAGIKKLLLIFGIAVNVGALCYYKYLFNILAALTPWLASMAGHEVTIMSQSPALPLGISFYTFSLLSYLLDVYWGICEAQKNYLNIWLYVAFFPKVVQGPIMRYADFEGQLHDRTVDLTGLNEGLERFIKGMFKKVMIADQLSGLVAYSFSNIGGVGTVPAWISVICYMLQLYYDFSGYSDMAVGLARMMGFTIPENFDHPYMSSSVAEYWRRWHISLGAWFRDYVYTPVIRSLTQKKWAKKLKKPFLVCDALALVVTWTLTGIWHGSGLQFLIYGLWFGMFIILERLRDDHRKTLKKQGRLKTLKRTGWRKALDHVVTMLAVTIGMVFFRADSLTTALRYLKRMFVWSAVDDVLMLSECRNYLVVFLVVALVFVFPVYGKVKAKMRHLFAGTKWEPVARLGYRIGLFAAFLLSFVFAVSNGYESFLYEVF